MRLLLHRILFGKTIATNVAEGMHLATLTKRADAAISTRYLLVKIGSDNGHVAACGATDMPLGVCMDEADAAEDLVAVRLLGCGDSTVLMVASDAITADSLIYTDAGGKVTATGGSGQYKVGRALTAAAADGDVIEVEPCFPVVV